MAVAVGSGVGSGLGSMVALADGAVGEEPAALGMKVPDHFILFDALAKPGHEGPDVPAAVGNRHDPDLATLVAGRRIFKRARLAGIVRSQ